MTISENWHITVVMRLPAVWRCGYLTARNLAYVVPLAQIVVFVAAFRTAFGP